MKKPSFWARHHVQKRMSKFVLSFFSVSSVMTTVAFTDLTASRTEAAAVTVGIADRLNLGKENYWNFYTRDLGANWNAALNTGTGNLTINRTLFQITGRGLPLVETLTYNAMSKQDNGTGAGWSLGSSMYVKENTDGSVVYRDDNATNHTFTRTTTGTYIAPAGTFLKLTKVSTGVFTIEDKEKTVHRFTNGQLVSVSDAKGNQTTLTYTSGKLTKMTDPSGRALSYTYDANGRVSTITDPASRVIQFGYDPATGELKTVTDARQNVTSFTYDATGTLNGFVDGNGRTTSFAYDSTGRLLKITDPRTTAEREYATTVAYNTTTRTTTVTDPANKTTSYEHNTAFNLLKQTNGAGNVSSYTWSANSMTQSVDGKGTTNYKYDASGNVTEESETISATETSTSTTTYDSKDNPVNITDPNLNKTAARYDAKSNELSSSNPQRAEADSKTYDANGNMTSSSDSTAATYNLLENGSFERLGTNGLPVGWNKGGDPNSITVDTSYAKYGASSLKISNATTATNFAYSNAIAVKSGQKLTLSAEMRMDNVVSNGPVAPGAQLGMEFYDSNGNYITSSYSNAYEGTGGGTETVTAVAPSNAVNVYVILELVDASGTVRFDGVQLESPQKADEGHVLSDYDYVENSSFERAALWGVGGIGSGSFTAEAAWSGTYSAKLANTTSGTTYLASASIAMKPSEPLTLSGYMKTVSLNGSGARIEIEYYDAAGAYLGYNATALQAGTQDFTKYSISITPPANTARATVYGVMYNSTGNVFFDNLKVTPRGTTLYGYDANGNYQTASLDMYGNLLQYGYDAVGNRTSFTDARNYKTQYAYDANNNLTSVTDPLSKVTHYNYDPLNKQVTIRDARSASATDDTYKTSFAYNELNQITAQTDALNRTLANTYDAAGNKESTTYPNGNKIEYAYDGANRIQNKLYTGGTASWTYAYDNTGNLSTVTDESNRSYGFGYDKANRINSMTDVYGYNITHAMDKSGNVTSTTDSGSKTVRYSYGSDNRINSMTDPSGRVTSYNYDGKGNVFETIRGNGARSNQIFDRLGRISRYADPGHPDGGSTDYYFYDGNGNITNIQGFGGQEFFSYDALNRLTSWTDKAGQVTSYQYDDAGNLLQKGDKTFAYNAAHEITNTGFSYDANGNMTSDGVNNYVYDQENRLIQVTKVADGSTVATYAYDYRGLRISKTTANGTVRFHWDDKQRLIRESDGTGNTIALYFYTGNQLVAMEKGGIMYYTHTNHRGDIVGVSDQNKNIVTNYTYGPYGEPLQKVGNVDVIPFRYAGYYYDEETGLYYVKARYYSPEIGRFMTRDQVDFAEMTEPLSLNPYAYVHGNPVKYVDPEGKWVSWPGVFSVGISLSKMSFGSSGKTSWGHGSHFSTVLYGTTVGSITQNVGRLVKAQQNSTGIFANPYATKASTYQPSYRTTSYKPAYTSYTRSSSYGSYSSSSYSSSRYGYTSTRYYGGSTRYSSFS